jgi:hypothetical protein
MQDAYHASSLPSCDATCPAVSGKLIHDRIDRKTLVMRKGPLGCLSMTAGFILYI